jgi:tetratricopeptide (TPR) repeat protein
MRDTGGFAESAMKTKSALLFLLLLALLLFCCHNVWAQGIPAGGGTSTATRPDSIGDLGYSGYMANSPGGVAAGAGLWGKVVVDGNPLVWEPIPIALSCSTGKTDLTTGAGPDGRFAITRVNLPTVYTVDGDVRRQMEQHYEGCTVRAEVAGYRSTADTITEKVLRDKPFLEDITLTPEENAPGTDISSVTGSASPEAQAYFRKAHEEWLHRNPDAAKGDLEQVVRIDPNFAEAQYLLGRLQATSDLKAATDSLKQAQAIDPRFVPPCVWLATIAIQKRDWQEASAWASRALELNPAGTARIWYENAVADYRLGKNEAARAAAEHALAVDPEHNLQNAEDVLALALINKGDYSGALAHLRNSLTYVSAGPDADLIKRQIAFVEQKAGATRK